MINVTLPDEKSNYVHRIGRVGRAERMGLAISLVSSVPEKVIHKSNIFFYFKFIIIYRSGTMENGVRQGAAIVKIQI